MKRSRQINLQQHQPGKKPLATGLKVSALAVGAGMLTGCDSQQAYIYQTIYECSLDNPGYDNQCRFAYQQALTEWQQTAPRYNSMSDCEFDFGQQQCEQRTPYFIPLLAGFMLGENNATDEEFDLDFKRSKPLGSSKRKGSPAYGRWVSAKGDLYGNIHSNRLKVSGSAFKPSKGGSRVMSRGGFGSSVSSRSSGG